MGINFGKIAQGVATGYLGAAIKDKESKDNESLDNDSLKNQIIQKKIKIKIKIKSTKSTNNKLNSCNTCYAEALIQEEGMLVCTNCGLIMYNIIDQQQEWRFMERKIQE